MLRIPLELFGEYLTCHWLKGNVRFIRLGRLVIGWHES